MLTLTPPADRAIAFRAQIAPLGADLRKIGEYATGLALDQKMPYGKRRQLERIAALAGDLAQAINAL
jgi:hypothetical protein